MSKSKLLPQTKFRRFEGRPGHLAMGACAPVGPIVFDTETCALHPDDAGGRALSVVSVAWESAADGPMSAAWAFAQGRYGKPEDDGKRTLFDGDDEETDARINLPRDEWWSLMQWLWRAGSGLICHNAKFDLMHVRCGVMRRTTLQDERRRGGWDGLDLSGRIVLDTAIAARELWPLESAALKSPPDGLAIRLFGADQADEQRALKPYLGPARSPRYDLVPWDVMEPYAARDAEQTWDVARVVTEYLEEDSGLRAAVRRELAISMELYRMEWAGLPYDAAGSVEVARELDGRLQEAAGKLPFPVDEAKQFYFGREPRNGVAGGGGPVVLTNGTKGLGLQPYEVTKVRQDPVFTADTMDRLARDEVPWARELAEHKKGTTARSMWYEGYASKVGPDGRLRCMFRQAASGRGEASGGTASGRFSVERVNLQAIPHDYRLSGSVLEGLPTPRGLVAKAVEQTMPGWGLWELDLAQAEMRAAALEAGCEAMVDAFVHGRDLHGETCTALFGLKPDDHRWYQMRTVAKRANFSLIFGSGAVTFMNMVRQQAGIVLSSREAARVVEDWNALYPEYQRAIDRWSRFADRTKFVPLVNGRRSWFRWGEDTHKSLNRVIQGSLAELGKEWLLGTGRYMHELDMARRGEVAGIGRAGLVLVVHDSQVLLLPDDEADTITEHVAQIGRDVWERLFGGPNGIPGGIDVSAWKG